MAQCVADFSKYSFDNKTSSVQNAGNYDGLYLYKDRNGWGTPKYRAKGQVYSTMPDGWNNTISSAYFASYYGYHGDAPCNQS
jgi:hypothetical protein